MEGQGPTRPKNSFDEKRKGLIRYEVREYDADNPLPPVTSPEKDAKNFPIFRDLSPEQVLYDRNEVLANECKLRKLGLSNVAQIPVPDPYLKKETNKGQNPYELTKVKSVVKDVEETRIATRKKLIFRDTNRKLQKFQKRSSDDDDKEFCYWQFQNSLKLKAISKESCWLKNNIGVTIAHLTAVLNRSDSTTLNLRIFQNVYGPINIKEDGMKNLLANFSDKITSVEVMKRRLKTLLEFSKKFGETGTIKAIEDMEGFALERLKLPGHLPGYRLMEMRKDENSIFNVNPLKNSSHTDWFHLKRFVDKVGPSNLFIRHEKLEKLGLVEYQPSPRTAIVTGLCASFIDTIFTFPVKKSREGWDKNMNHICDCIRCEINLYTCGVEIGLFFKRLKNGCNISEKAFERLSEEGFVARLPEIVIVTELPRTKAKILFPNFMRFILPVVDGQLGVLLIIEKFWRRTVFLVREKGGFMRNMDFKWAYWNFFKKGIVIQEWGFGNMESFVTWCNQEWNADGLDECVVVKYHSGSGDPFLVYLPRVKGIGKGRGKIDRLGELK